MGWVRAGANALCRVASGACLDGAAQCSKPALPTARPASACEALLLTHPPRLIGYVVEVVLRVPAAQA
eukprot:14846550-Alexandrium_andersonii.AAC.1